MNLNYQQKISLLQNLLKLTRVDHIESDIEVDFIYRIGDRLQIQKEEVDQLLKKEIEFEVPKQEGRRIELFYTFLLVMGVDGHLTDEEAGYCKDIGFQLGLNPLAVEHLIQEMMKRKATKVPASEIINFFKLYHN